MALSKLGLWRTYKNFSYRWWSARWNTWLFYNPTDTGWYFYSSGCRCWLPAQYIAYDAPEEEEMPDIPDQMWAVKQLPSNDPPVQAPQEPSQNPPPVPGVQDDGVGQASDE